MIDAQLEATNKHAAANSTCIDLRIVWFLSGKGIANRWVLNPNTMGWLDER